jgi:hypothetical protein
MLIQDNKCVLGRRFVYCRIFAAEMGREIVSLKRDSAYLMMHMLGFHILSRKSLLSVMLVVQTFRCLKLNLGSSQISEYIMSNSKSPVISDMPLTPCTCSSNVTLVPDSVGRRWISYVKRIHYHNSSNFTPPWFQTLKDLD